MQMLLSIQSPNVLGTAGDVVIVIVTIVICKYCNYNYILHIYTLCVNGLTCDVESYHEPVSMHET